MLSFLLRPLNIFLIALILAFVFYKLKYNKTCRVLIIAAFAELILFSCTPFPLWLVKNLESKYNPYVHSPGSKPMRALILGSGHTNDPRLNDIQDLNPKALSRLVEGLRLYYSRAAGKIVTSGRQTDNTVTAVTSARSALLLGVSPKDTLMMVKPLTTWEEARDYKQRFGTGEPFILVTSAVHMPRAMETFKSMGMKPIPAPADYMVKNDSLESPYTWKPELNKLSCTELAMHEYIGILYYRWFK